MNYFEKIWQIITKDVNNDNELKKPAVIIRCVAIVMFFYSLFNALLMLYLKLIAISVICAVFALGYVLVFYMAFHYRTKICYYLEMIMVTGGVIFSVWMFGWSTGVQYFIFVLIVYTLVTSHVHNIYKYLICGTLCVICLVLYAISVYKAPNILLDDSIQHILQVANIITVCFVLTVMVSLFSSDSLMQEEKLMEYNRKVTHLASIDPLTGLINRRSTKEQIANLIDAGREEVPFISLAMGDIDFFKKVNDTYGHEGGDEVLKGLSKLFLEETKGVGMVCRWGGEEFLFILPSMNGDEAFNFMEHLRRKVKTVTFNLNKQEFHVSMTFGVQEHDFRDTIDASIDNADRKLYIGKSSGRDRVIY